MDNSKTLFTIDLAKMIDTEVKNLEILVIDILLKKYRIHPKILFKLITEEIFKLAIDSNIFDKETYEKIVKVNEIKNELINNLDNKINDKLKVKQILNNIQEIKLIYKDVNKISKKEVFSQDLFNKALNYASLPKPTSLIDEYILNEDISSIIKKIEFDNPKIIIDQVKFYADRRFKSKIKKEDFFKKIKYQIQKELKEKQINNVKTFLPLIIKNLFKANIILGELISEKKVKFATTTEPSIIGINMIIDDLIEKGKAYFYKDSQEKVIDQRFKAIKETTIHQVEKCNFYHQLCRQKKFNPTDLKSINDIVKIPYLTTANFKQRSGRPKELLCVPESDILVWTMSSGTSGDPSLIGRDAKHLVRYFKIFDFVLEELCSLTKYDWSFFFQPRPRQRLTKEDKVPEPLNHMGYIFNVANKLPMEKRHYALKLADEESRKKGKLFEFDAETTFGFFNANPAGKGIGWIGGAVPIMYGTLKGYYEKTGQVFNVGEKSVLISGGGWKSFSGETVSPVKFREDMTKILGIPQEQILDIYTSTESDCLYSDCEYHNKHLLPWQDVIVRDVESLEPVEMGEKGLINIINPIVYSYAGVSILQDDIVRVVMEDDCPCGRKGKIIEIFGRAEGPEAKIFENNQNLSF